MFYGLLTNTKDNTKKRVISLISVVVLLNRLQVIVRHH